MEIRIRPATASDLDDIERLYDELNDYLAAHVNYPGWKKGSYPLRSDAETGLNDGALYVAERNGDIAAAVIYQPGQSEVYRPVNWQLPFDVPVLTVHTLAVHPNHQGAGVARALMDYAEALARQNGARAIRLDTHLDNAPAIRLYEKCGYADCGLVDLGLEEFNGFKWYRAFEKVLQGGNAQ